MVSRFTELNAKTGGFHSPTFSMNTKARSPDFQFDAKTTRGQTTRDQTS
jgi:hypothetical protein